MVNTKNAKGENQAGATGPGRWWCSPPLSAHLLCVAVADATHRHHNHHRLRRRLRRLSPPYATIIGAGAGAVVLICLLALVCISIARRPARMSRRGEISTSFENPMYAMDRGSAAVGDLEGTRAITSGARDAVPQNVGATLGYVDFLARGYATTGYMKVQAAAPQPTGGGATLGYMDVQPSGSARRRRLYGRPAQHGVDNGSRLGRSDDLDV